MTLLTREYLLGEVRYVYAGAGETDDRGNYSLRNVDPSRGYLLLAKKFNRNLNATSKMPYPKWRKRAFVPTWYPASDSIDGAQLLQLQTGEHREGMDIRLIRKPSFCLDGFVTSGQPSANLRYSLKEPNPSSGTFGSQAWFLMESEGTPDADGKIRICDLHPGDYEITAFQISQPGASAAGAFFGVTNVTIGDRDVHSVHVTASSAIAISAEVVSDTADAKQKVSLRIMPVKRAPFPQEVANSGLESAIPGRFRPFSLWQDDYRVQVIGVPENGYLKELTYGGLDVLTQPMRVGKTTGTDLLVSLGYDGTKVSARVADEDGKPVPESTVVLIPASAATEAAVADSIITGTADQNGEYTSKPFAPGKYFALAVSDPIDHSLETIAKLAQARVHAQELNLGPAAKTSITLTPVPLN